MKTYCFGACEVRPATREVVLHGQVQFVEPRVFAFLVYLIEQSPRAVPKAELLRELWGHEHLSASVLSRAALLARRAVGDEEGDGRWIKTVHRVGYRFVGPVQEKQEPSLAPPGPPSHPRRRASDVLAAVAAPALAPAAQPARRAGVPASAVSVCLLPFGNDTQDDMLGWVAFGLMTMVSHLLERDRRIAVMEAPNLLNALRQLPAGQTREQQIQVLQALLGVRYVVATSVSRCPEGFLIGFSGYSREAVAFQGEVRGPELAALGPVMATAIGARLFPGSQAVATESPLDPFAADALGRALQAMAEDRWDDAARLLNVVLDIEPGHTFAQLVLLRSLVLRNLPSAFAEGAHLLERAHSAGDLQAQATVHSLLALAHLQSNATAAVQEAQRHMRLAIDLVQSQPLADWATEIFLGASLINMVCRELNEALQLCHRFEDASAMAGNQHALGLALMRRGSILSVMGERAEARLLLERAALLQQQFNQHDRSVACTARLAQLTGWLGDLEAARVHCATTWQALPKLRDSRNMYFCALLVSILHADLREPEPIDAFLAEFGSGPPAPSSLALFFTHALQAHHALAHSQHARARAHLRPVYQESLRVGALVVTHFWAQTLLPVLGRLQAWDEAAALRDELVGLPSFAEDHELQGVVLHSQAMEAHQRGDEEAALHLLAQANGLMPAGRWRNYVRLDTVWLLVERGELEAAQDMLGLLGAWAKEHPLGLLVSARVAAAQGQWADARLNFLQQQKRTWMTDGTYAQAVQAALAAGAAAGAAGALDWPRAPALISLV